MSDLTSLRVLIATPRQEYRSVSYAAPMDFEDAAARASTVDFVRVPLRSRRVALERTLRGHPPRRVTAPNGRYDVCFLAAMGSFWIPSLRYVQNLQRIADRVVVYLYDAWVSELPRLTRDDSGLDLVDDLVVSFDHVLDEYQSALGCRVHYLPQALDQRWFHPYRQSRPIDILSVGRRLPEVHSRILRYSRERDLFYYFQEARRPEAIDIRESQELIGRICQSSRVHVSWSVAATQPERANEGDAITARWFEAASCAGRVVGQAPHSEEFSRLFPYAHFVRTIDPSVPGQLEEVLSQSLAEVDGDDARLALAEHVRTAHTWDNRWRELIEICGV